MSNKLIFINERKNWVPPKFSAIGRSRLVNDTSKWISSNMWYYVFLPILRYASSCSISIEQYKCTHYKIMSIESNSYK